MKNKTFNLFLVTLLLFAFSCNSSSEQQREPQGEEPTEPVTDLGEAPAPEAEAPAEDGSFKVTVVKGDIASPRKEMKGRIGDVELTVNYGSPSVKGRTIWGDLVPYGQVWRTGANEATTIELSKAVKVADQELPAGKYGLFTIPKEDGWTIIFNTTADQWGSYEYDKSKDVLRVDVDAKAAAEASETMEFMIDGDAVVLAWDKIQVPFSITAS